MIGACWVGGEASIIGGCAIGAWLSSAPVAVREVVDHLDHLVAVFIDCILRKIVLPLSVAT